MGEKTLVENQIIDAINLIKKLDDDGRSPTLVVWFYYDDADEWRLLIAGSTFDALLPKREAEAYKYLIEAMASISPSSLTISDLKLVNTKTPLPQALCYLIRTNPNETVRAHFTNTTLNGIFIKEMIILRSAI